MSELLEKEIEPRRTHRSSRRPHCSQLSTMSGHFVLLAAPA
jgi:hypothetical protein